MAQNNIRGVLSPVLTPFNADYSVARDAFLAHCRALVQCDVGLAVFGTNSEANSLSMAEKRELLDMLVENGIAPQRLMPGTGACALPDAIELSRHATELGAAGVLMLPPFYYKGVSDEGLFRYYASVIDTIANPALRVYLYHIPQVTQVGISMGLIERLLRAYPENIAGIKDSSGDWDNTQAMLTRFQPQGFDVFAGSESFLLRTLQGGGVGCITATGNVNAAQIAALAATWQNEDAAAQQAQLDTVRGIFQKLPMIPAMKAAIADQTGRPDWSIVRPPLVELDAAQQSQLKAALAGIGFTVNQPARTSM
ncbi:MAG: dihydrodipicolinate synthase family protein [Comamonadaceae bacterium]|nr:MAG: dihydrodipicolinate synthase family protein [Comamonadaceae bacterium]